jgi:cell division protein FtsB
LLRSAKIKRRRELKRKIIIFPIILLLGLLFLIISDMGIFKWYQLRNQRNIIENDINKMILEEKKLNIELDKLLNDKEYIKKIAQEKFHMIKSGEKVFRVRDRKK